MAAATVESELAIVNIIRPVAVAAAIAESQLHLERLAVAALARDSRVRAVQGEAGLLVVVEPPLSPVDRVVAAGAVLAEATVVWIFVAVAAGAIVGCVAEHVRVMALRALELGVRTEQRKLRQAMVEENIVRP